MSQILPHPLPLSTPVHHHSVLLANSLLLSHTALHPSRGPFQRLEMQCSMMKLLTAMKKFGDHFKLVMVKLCNIQQLWLMILTSGRGINEATSDNKARYNSKISLDSKFHDVDESVPLVWVWLASQQNPFYRWFCCSHRWYCIRRPEL